MKLIPEKTIEAWTVSALLEHLSPDVCLWSPSKGEDQRVWDPALSKIFLLELKAPTCESGWPPQQAWTSDLSISIDLEQLQNYVVGYRLRLHPDVIYVLPDPNWSVIPRSATGNPFLAHHRTRRSFPNWAYVIRASRLLDMLQNGSARKRALVRVERQRTVADVKYAPRSPAGSHQIQAGRFVDALSAIKDCGEPTGLATRSSSLRRRDPKSAVDIPGLEAVDRDDEDLPLTGPLLEAAFGAIYGGECKSGLTAQPPDTLATVRREAHRGMTSEPCPEGFVRVRLRAEVTHLRKC